MALGLIYRRLDFSFPPAEPPAWSVSVDRWYQLDAAAYGLCEAVARWRGDAALPGFLFLASPGASNETDARFAAGGAASPSKFVHTLPSVRGSALCQVLGWSGPMLCVQNDPATLCTAIEEAYDAVGPSCEVAWVLGVTASTAHAFEIQGGRPWERSSAFRISRGREAMTAQRDDARLLRWLDPTSDTKRFALALGLSLERAS